MADRRPLRINPGHALTATKGNAQRGIPRRPILPTAQETAILRRVAAGYCTVTFIDGRPHYGYEDGTPLPLRRPRSDPDGENQFRRMVANGWLIPDQGDSLFPDGPPQIYRARRP